MWHLVKLNSIGINHNKVHDLRFSSRVLLQGLLRVMICLQPFHQWFSFHHKARSGNVCWCLHHGQFFSQSHKKWNCSDQMHQNLDNVQSWNHVTNYICATLTKPEPSSTKGTKSPPHVIRWHWSAPLILWDHYWPEIQLNQMDKYHGLNNMSDYLTIIIWFPKVFSCSARHTSGVW